MREGEQMTRTIRALRGQITIPAEFRRQLGMTEESLLQMTLVDGELRLRPVEAREQGKGSPWLKEAYDLFRPVRQEAIEKGYTEEEINTAIDEAIAAVRAERG